MLPDVPAGITDASATRKRESTTASGSEGRPLFGLPTGWKVVVPTWPAAWGGH